MDLGVILFGTIGVVFLLFLTDHSRNSFIGFRTPLSRKSKKNWVHSQWMCYGTLLPILALSILLKHLLQLSVQVYYAMIMAGILLSAVFTELELIRFSRKQEEK